MYYVCLGYKVSGHVLCLGYKVSGHVLCVFRV